MIEGIILLFPSICSCLSISSHVFVFFSDAQPTDGEKAVFEEVGKVLMRAFEVLDDLQRYRGAGDEIRDVSRKFDLYIGRIRDEVCYKRCEQ